MNLTCKIQYKTFEPGEFTDIRQVDFITAVDIIEKFPWGEQRDHIAIDLTCPSVSFEYSPDSILKLSLYYNKKFVLYFFDGKHLHTKSFTDYKSAYSFIEYFFKEKSIDFSAFKKENTWLKKIVNHFRTADFVYTVKGKPVYSFFDFETVMVSVMQVFLLPLFISFSITKTFHFYALLLPLFLFIFWGGINYFLLFTYYLYSKNKYLQLSKGNDIFLWGEYPDNIKKYSKSDIKEIIVKQNKGRRCPWGNFTLTFIFIKNGSFLKIPSTLLDGMSIQFKIPDAPYEVEQTAIPLCKLNS